MSASDAVFTVALQTVKVIAAYLVFVWLAFVAWYLPTVLQALGAYLEYLRDKARTARDWQSNKAHIAKRERVRS